MPIDCASLVTSIGQLIEQLFTSRAGALYPYKRSSANPSSVSERLMDRRQSSSAKSWASEIQFRQLLHHQAAKQQPHYIILTEVV